MLTTAAPLVCTRCKRVLNKSTVVPTRAGPYCKQHADRLPPYLRRPRKGSR